MKGIRAFSGTLATLLFFLFLAVVAHGAADLPPVEHVEEESNLFLFGFLVVGLCVILFLFAASLVLGVIAAVATALLVGLGIVSLATLFGLLQRRLSAGIRAFHYQVCAVAAVPAGIGVLWLGTHLLRLAILPRDVLIIGSIAGAGSGLLLAFVFDRLASMAYRRFAPPSIPDAAGNA